LLTGVSVITVALSGFVLGFVPVDLVPLLGVLPPLEANVLLVPGIGIDP